MPETSIAAPPNRPKFHLQAIARRRLKYLPFAFEIPPFARLDEARPIERMAPISALDHLQLHSPQPFSPSFASLQRLVIPDHQVSRPGIRYRPQTHDLRLRTRQRQRPPQSIGPFTILHLASVARSPVKTVACGSIALSARASPAVPLSGGK